MGSSSEQQEGSVSLRSIEDRTYEALRRIGLSLQLPIDKSDLDLGDVAQSVRDTDDFGLLIAGARQVGVLIREAELEPDEIKSTLVEGFTVIAAFEDGSMWIFENLVGMRVEATCINHSVQTRLLRPRQIRDLLERDSIRTFVAKKELECDLMSGAGTVGTQPASNDDDHHGGHPPPFRRLLGLLRLDQRDVLTVALFALVAGVLALATPLAIESLVNVVSWGTYLQPLLILALMLLACLGMAGMLRVLQTVVVEIIQRRQFVRIIGDLAHRFPRANQAALEGKYPRELANRMFDIMTIQKSSAILLLDGISILLTTVLGLLLLAFYHPFLLGFDVVLIISMVSMTWVLGRGGVQTAIEESVTKYRIVHWLQDVLAMPNAFKVNGGEFLAAERANRLASEYLLCRQRQFRVVLRQVVFAISLQVVASTVLLGLGGWLVMRQQLTLGQLVASELVVTVVVGAFAKAGKSLEKFYDLMAGIDKVGHLLDIPVDPRYELGGIPDGPAELRLDRLSFHFEATGSTCEIPETRIAPGARVAVTGNDRSGKSLLLKALAGLVKPHQGMAEVCGLDAQQAALGGNGSVVAYAGASNIFQATIQENVDLGRHDIGQNRVRQVLAQVGLWETVLALPFGLRTNLQTGGTPLSRTQRAQLEIARAMAGAPRLLLIDGVLDELTAEVFEIVFSAITADDAPWTLMVATNHQEIADRFEQKIVLGGQHG